MCTMGEQQKESKAGDVGGDNEPIKSKNCSSKFIALGNWVSDPPLLRLLLLLFRVSWSIAPSLSPLLRRDWNKS